MTADILLIVRFQSSPSEGPTLDIERSAEYFESTALRSKKDKAE